MFVLIGGPLRQKVNTVNNQQPKCSHVYCVYLPFHATGSKNLLSFQESKKLCSVKEHRGPITDLQMSQDLTMIITSSKDTTAKVSFCPCSRKGKILHMLMVIHIATGCCEEGVVGDGCGAWELTRTY